MTAVLKACLVCCALHLACTSLAADVVDDQLAVISAAGPGGKGSAAARKARSQLAGHGVKIIPRLLIAMDTPNTVAANWYRTIYEQIVRRELAKPDPKLPRRFLKQYARDPKRQGRVRRLVLDLADRFDPGFAGTLIPTLLDDPEFRNDAIIATMNRGDTAKNRGDTEWAKQLYTVAFRHARESSEVTQAADRLRSIGEEVNIVNHMGFVIDWYLLGPFDAPGKTGFGLSFPPEKKVNLKATYDGKNGTQIGWKRHRTGDRLGQLNLVSAIAPVNEAVGYAFTEIDSPCEQTVQVRCGADDNLTVWLNGEKVFSQLQWLNGIRFDRFTAAVTLSKGRNRLLVKICQGPQHKNDWTKSTSAPSPWSMQLRFCNAQGAGVGVTSALPPLTDGTTESPNQK